MDSISYETLIKSSKNIIDARLKFRDRRRANRDFYDEPVSQLLDSVYTYDTITYKNKDMDE